MGAREDRIRELEARQAELQAMLPSSGLDEAAGASGVGFMDRLLSGLAMDQSGQADILKSRGYDVRNMRNGDLGVVTDRPSGRQVLSAVDVADVPELGDLADLVGELPSGILGALGAVGGAAIPLPGTGPALSAAGSAAGDYARQKMAQAAGSETPWNPVQTGVEAIAGGVGELVTAPLTKLAKGPFRGSAADYAGARTAAEAGVDFVPTTGGGQINRVMQDVAEADVKYGKNVGGLAPIDVQTGSEPLAAMTQRVRESEFGGQTLKEGQDYPFYRELESLLERMRGESGGGAPGAVASPVGKRQAGADLREAMISTGKERGARVNAAYDEFRGMIDPEAPVPLTNTQRAIQEIQATDLYKQYAAGKKTGTAGMAEVANAIEEAQDLPTLDALMQHRVGVGNQVTSFDPSRMSRGAEAHLKKLGAALRADEDEFLTTGGAGVAGGGDLSIPFKKGETRAVTANQVAERIDRVSDSTLDVPEIKRVLNGESPHWAETTVDVSALRGHQGISATGATPGKGSVVVLADGTIIDGRHRVARAVAEGETTVEAFVPVRAPEVGLGAAEAGKRARDLASDRFVLDEASVMRMFRDPLKRSEMVDKMMNMNADEVEAIWQIAGARGTAGGHVSTAEGRQVAEEIGDEVWSMIREIAKDPQRSTRDQWVPSPTRLSTWLDQMDKKPGRLQALIGAEGEADLRLFADILKGTSVSERGFANRSLTSQGEQSSLNELASFLTNPKATAGRIAGRFLSQKFGARLLGSQGGKRFLLGQTAAQQYPGVISALGRLGGQVGGRYGANELGIRR